MQIMAWPRYVLNIKAHFQQMSIENYVSILLEAEYDFDKNSGDINL